MSTNEFIIGLINMSITASYVTVIVLIIRLLLRRFPKKYSYALWGIVGLRLIFPISVSSVFSFFNLSAFRGISTGEQLEYVPADIEYSLKPTVNTGITAVNNSVNAILPGAEPTYSANPLQIYLTLLFYIWLSGVLLILIYEVFMHIKTKKLVRKAVIYRDNIYECDKIPTPFVMGIIKPKIYIPFRLEKRELSYIICHEEYHIKRLDHIIKAISFMLVVVYWFNPFVWIAYFCMNTDMEKSCDEWVLIQMGNDIKSEYSTSLLSFAINRRGLPLGPLAFGETSVGGRIKNILKFRKPSKALGIMGMAIVILAACVCVTNGKNKDTADSEMVSVWAEAFCDRDGDAIKAMSTDEAVASLLEEQLFYDEESLGNGWFGWSSAWPWSSDFAGVETEKYRIIKDEADEAVILYYAMDSSPHIYVWRETLSYKPQDDSLIVSAEKTEFLEQISSIEEFYRAYPDDIEDTFLDYSTNGLGEILNRNYLREKEEGHVYIDLSDPETAALYLLNIQPEAVETELCITEGVDIVEVNFIRDNTRIKIAMAYPFGSAGISIPKYIIMPAVSHRGLRYGTYKPTDCIYIALKFSNPAGEKASILNSVVTIEEDFFQIAYSDGSTLVQFTNVAYSEEKIDDDTVKELEDWGISVSDYNKMTRYNIYNREVIKQRYELFLLDDTLWLVKRGKYGLLEGIYSLSYE